MPTTTRPCDDVRRQPPSGTSAGCQSPSIHARIRGLPDDRLLSRLDELATRERRLTHCIVDHLAEVERRELFAGRGFSSMFSYCTSHLGYSASAASRRIRTARCVRRFPRVRVLLERNRVNLSTVSMVAGILTDENCDDILRRIEGRSQREVEAVVAACRPRGSIRDEIKPVALEKESPRPRVGNALPLGAPSGELSSQRRDNDGGGCTGAAPPAPACASGDTAADSATPVPSREASGSDLLSATGERLERQFVIRFAAGPQFVRQIETARSLLSHSLASNASLAHVLGAVLADFIERRDPVRRAVRRTRCKDKKKRSKRAERTHDRSGCDAGSPAGNPRAVPAAMRDEVMAKSGKRCEFVSSSGRRCDATMYLQVDHVTPVALGGTASRENLRVLCARHNREEARRLLGDIVVSRAREGDTQRRRRRPAVRAVVSRATISGCSPRGERRGDARNADATGAAVVTAEPCPDRPHAGEPSPSRQSGPS